MKDGEEVRNPSVWIWWKINIALTLYIDIVNIVSFLKQMLQWLLQWIQNYINSSSAVPDFFLQNAKTQLHVSIDLLQPLPNWLAVLTLLTMAIYLLVSEKKEFFSESFFQIERRKTLLCWFIFVFILWYLVLFKLNYIWYCFVKTNTWTPVFFLISLLSILSWQRTQILLNLPPFRFSYHVLHSKP